MVDMTYGNLYFDNNPKLTPDYKILDLSRHYFQKFKKAPTLCHVNPETYNQVIGEYSLNAENFKIVHGIRVEPDKLVELNQYMFGEIE